jgi:hypothetical protein
MQGGGRQSDATRPGHADVRRGPDGDDTGDGLKIIRD